MSDLTKLVSEQLEKSLTEDSLKPLIEEKVNALVEDIISDELRKYGNFGESLKAVVHSQLDVNLNDLDLTSFSSVLMTAVKTKVQKSFSTEMHKKVLSSIDDVFESPPEEITINDLCQKLLGLYWNDESDDSIELTVDFDEHDITNWHTLTVKESERYGSEVFSLHISNNLIRINHKMAYNPTCLDDIELFIFKCYMSKTKITELDNFDSSAECFNNPHHYL